MLRIIFIIVFISSLIYGSTLESKISGNFEYTGMYCKPDLTGMKTERTLINKVELNLNYDMKYEDFIFYSSIGYIGNDQSMYSNMVNKPINNISYLSLYS